ncbi:T9SS type A sorting domain-containing protein [bacterium]|nr:T9SS type A sorting domain-containing protein [bacterium]
MKKFFIAFIGSLMLFNYTNAQSDNGNKFKQVWHSSLSDFVKGNLVNAGMDIDGDGWGEFLVWDVTTQTYLLYEAFADDQYHIVYRDNELLNFFDLDRDGKLELVKIHQDAATLQQWMTIHEWNGKNLNADFSGGFLEPVKTTNRIPRSFWYGIAEGHGFDRGVWDFKDLDGDQDWDIIAVDAKLTVWGGQVVRWNEGTIINILEMTNFDTESPQISLRYTSGSLANGMRFFGVYNSYIDIDKDGLMDNIFVSDHAQTLMGIRTAGNDQYDPIVVSRLSDALFYHLPSWPIVADFDGDALEDIFFGDLDGQVWYTQAYQDFQSTLSDYNILLLNRVVPKQSEPGATNMCIGGHLGDQDGDGKPDIYFFSKDINSLIDIEYQGGFAGELSSFSFTYTKMYFPNGDLMNATMWEMQTGARYGFPLLDMDGDGKRELILGAVDTDNMVTRGIPTLYILESEHQAITAVNKTCSALPEHFRLLQNYPNPFNPATTIEFTLTKPGLVTITIYDINGRLVRNLLCEQCPAGHQTVVWNAKDNNHENICSGVYFCVFNSPDFRATKKMMLIR